MFDGVGHGEKRFDRRTHIADWFMKQLKAGREPLRTHSNLSGFWSKTRRPMKV